MSSSEYFILPFLKMNPHYLRLNARESLRDKSRISAHSPREEGKETANRTKSVAFPLPTSQQFNDADTSDDSGTCTSTEDVVSGVV